MKKKMKKSKILLDFSYILCYTTYACEVKNNIYRKGCKKSCIEFARKKIERNLRKWKKMKKLMKLEKR